MATTAEIDQRKLDKARAAVHRIERRRIPKPPILLPSPLSHSEATTYYHGLPSNPILIARTSTAPWHDDLLADSTPVTKELRPVGDHPFKDVWEDNLAFRVHQVLDSSNIDWTSTDVVRIRETTEQGDGELILWIGVKPASLSGYDGLDVATKCRDILLEYGIHDVHVEIRESAVTRWSPPPFKFLPVIRPVDQYAHLRTHLTTTLGIPLCAEQAYEFNATGGFFITANGDHDRLLLVTARHVILPLDKGQPNKLYKRSKNSQPKYPVAVMSDERHYYAHLEPIELALGRQALAQDALEERAQGAVDGTADPPLLDEELAKTRAVTAALLQVYKDLSTQRRVCDRILGHLILSPPLQYGPGTGGSNHDGYSTDWAVIEVNRDTVDSSNFYGNVIDLSVGSLSAAQLAEKLGPDFAYPQDHLLRLSGTLSNTELYRGRSEPGNHDLVVLKNGGGTGLTVGRANDVCSYARSTYFASDNNCDFIDAKALIPSVSYKSKEWAILPYDVTSGSFAFYGDSGSVVVDSQGRMGGIITGGAGTTRIISSDWGRTGPTPFASDLTYATPIHFLVGQMEQAGLKDINLNPLL